MADTMVTGRMSAEKKRRGLRALEQSGLNASQAIGLLFDRAIEEGNADFLLAEVPPSDEKWRAAACFVDGLSQKKESRFDDMDKAEIRLDRLKARGLM